MKENRVLLTEDDGDAEFLTKDINDSYIQNILDRLTNEYHRVTKTPNLTDEKFANNTSGVSLKFKLFTLEKDMSKKESKWKKSVQRMLELICNILNIKAANIDYRSIKVTFTRAMPSNTLETAQTIAQLAGMVSNETLIAQLDFIDNPKKELDIIKKEREEQMKDVDIYSDLNNDYDKKVAENE